MKTFEIARIAKNKQKMREQEKKHALSVCITMYTYDLKIED